jgi:ABC-type branched-subunit amino acid transport system substrate-binding protein
MRAAQAAITAGKRVRLDGASGVVEFDALGDRVAQPYETWTLRHGTTFEWVADEVWDAHSLQCIKHCHP